jgi:hypothetical protein
LARIERLSDGSATQPLVLALRLLHGDAGGDGSERVDAELARPRRKRAESAERESRAGSP